MSKRIIASCLIIGALAGSNAMASQARQIVLGTQDPLNVLSAGTHGSVLVDDNMNIFYNPSYAADFSNWASIEKASGYVGATGTQAEGGFVNNFGPVMAGVYLNRQDALGNLTNVTYANAPTRPFDLIVAGDMGVKWGLLLSHGSNKVGPTVTDNRDLGSSALNARVGIQVAGFEPFFQYQIIGKDTQTATGAAAALTTQEDKFKSMSFGTRYKFGEWVPFAVVRMDKFEDAPATAADTTTDEYKGNAYGIGFARNTKVAEGTALNYGASFWSLTRPAPTGAAATLTGNRSTQKVLPIDISVEHDAASWLAIRAGLSYRLMDKTNNLTNAAASTTGRIGAGLKLGKAMVDFAVGSGGGAAAAPNADQPTFDFSNGLFSVASLTYSW